MTDQHADIVCPSHLDTGKMFRVAGTIYTRPVPCDLKRGHGGLHRNDEYSWPHKWSDEWARIDGSPDA